jgi:hypothetical protein
MNLNVAVEKKRATITETGVSATQEAEAYSAGYGAAEVLNEVGPVLSLATVRPSFEQYIKEVAVLVNATALCIVDDDDSLKNAVALGGSAKKIYKIIEAQRIKVTAEASDFVSSVNGFCKIFTEKLVLNAKKSNADSIEAMLKNKITSYQSRIELERRKQAEVARKAAKELQDKLDAETAETNRKARAEAVKKAEEETRARLAKQSNIPINITTKGDGLLWKDEKMIGLPEADKVAIEYGFYNAEGMVGELDKRNKEIDDSKKAAEEEAKKHEIQAPTVVAQVFEQTNNVTRTESGTSSYQVKNWVCTVIDPAAVPREFCEPVKKLLDDAVKQGLREIAGCKIEEVSSTRFRA